MKLEPLETGLLAAVVILLLLTGLLSGMYLQDQSEISRLRNQTTTLENQISALQSQIAQYQAEIAALQKSIQANTTGEQTLVVGVDSLSPPFGYQLSNGTIVGFDVDLIRAVAVLEGYSGITIENYSSIDSLVSALQEGTVDVAAANIPITTDEMTQVNFTIPTWWASQCILVSASSGFDPTNMSDLAGKTVGVQTGSIGEDLAEQYNSSLGTIKHYGTFLQAVHDLVSGKVDAVLVDEPVTYMFYTNYPVKFTGLIYGDEEGLGFAVRLGDSDLLGKLNLGLTSFERSTDWVALLVRYFGT